MRPIRTIAVFPTLLTLGNLICGFFAIVVAARMEKPVPTSATSTSSTRPNVMLSGWLIFLAMVFDGLDGYVARLARTTSDFGAQLDSLCDVVSFGVAPGFLLVKMCPRFTLVHDQAVWIIAAAYAACAALRLARFNVETSDDDEHLYFSGLPSPAAAAVIAGFAIMFYTLRQDIQRLKNGIDTCLAGCFAVFRDAGGAADGLADPLSAHHQPACCAASGVSATWWPWCFSLWDHGGPGLRRADRRLGLRALRAGPSGVGVVDRAAPPRGTVFEGQRSRERIDMFSGIVEALGTVGRTACPSRRAAG